ncbi:hypothetical protein BHM03_00054525, partial [Ensete ventricosum]
WGKGKAYRFDIDPVDEQLAPLPAAGPISHRHVSDGQRQGYQEQRLDHGSVLACGDREDRPRRSHHRVHAESLEQNVRHRRGAAEDGDTQVDAPAPVADEESTCSREQRSGDGNRSRSILRGPPLVLTQDKEGSDCGNDRHVDQGGSEDEALGLFVESRCGEGRVGEQSRREEEVEQDDEERRSADEEEGDQHGGQEEQRLGPSPRPGARPRSGRAHRRRRLLLLHASQIIHHV